MKIFWNLLVIGTLLFYIPNVYAFTPPTANPPGGNVAAPINVSGTSQIKIGDFQASNLITNGMVKPSSIISTLRLQGSNNTAGRVEVWDRMSISNMYGYGSFPDPGNGGIYASGNLWGQLLYDSTNSNYYVDPNATSRLNVIFSDWVDSRVLVANGWVNAPIYYDINNTNYYLDPAGYSQAYVLYRYYGYNGPEYDINNAGYYIDPNATSRMNYTVNDNTYTYGTENANDFYIRSIGQWASQLRAGGKVTYLATCNVNSYNGSFSSCSPAEQGVSGNFMFLNAVSYANADWHTCAAVNQGSYSVYGYAFAGASSQAQCTFGIFRIDSW